MKKLLFTSAILLATLAGISQVRMPQPSPTQTLKQDFAMGSIDLSYSRPSMKGRKIFGDLVPYNKVWRTGANSATSIHFTEPVEIGGKQVDTGTYALYTIPSATSWQVLLNKGIKNWGAFGYDEKDNVVKVTVPVMKTTVPTESFTIQFANVKPESCELQMMWENTAVAVPIKANIKDKLRAQIEEGLKSDKKPYWQAAQFYNEYEKNLPKALENVTAASQQNPKAYWILLYKAKIQKEMGDKSGARESANASLKLATEDKNDDYIKLNNDLLKQL